MLKRLTLSAALLIPTVALALDIQPGSPYIDVKPGSKEAPAINLLTRAGVVKGIGDDRFGPSRLVNRAEFLKMAMALYLQAHDNPFSGYNYYKNGKVTKDGCFPDVRLTDWFGEFVCEAYDAGFVKGNPDGLFHPERTVQYDEALKILTLIFGYDIPNVTGADWVEPFYQSAVQRKVDLPVRIRFASPLTRAYAARLIGAFKAESEGELQNLRYAEAGRFDLITSVGSSSSMSSSASSTSSSSSSSSVSSSSSSVSSTSLFTLPPVSHFLLVGAKSDAIANVAVPAQSERVRFAHAQVKLFSEARSLENLEIVTEDGTVLATLLRKTTTDTSDYKLTFEGFVPLELQKTLEKDMPYNLVVRATVRAQDSGGFSEELVQVRVINIALQGETTNTTFNVASSAGFPKHQTAFSRISEVTRTSPATGTLQSGTDVLVSSFNVKAVSILGKSTLLDQTIFSLTKIGSFEMSEWKLSSGGQSIPCAYSEEGKTVTCLGLALAFGKIPAAGLALELHAKLTVPIGITGASLQADLGSRGSPESFGSLQWTDESAHFRWTEGPSPIATGTLLQ